MTAEPTTANEPIEIVQDCEVDPDGEVGGEIDVFWTKGHGHDPDAFVRAVVQHCLEMHGGVPRIDWEDKPVETWQQNVYISDGIEYRRDSTPPESPRSPRFPITLLDLSRRRRGAQRCAVADCREPFSVGSPVQVRIDPDDPRDGTSEATRYLAVCIYLCREHQKEFPEPSYRVCLVPVGATILLPEPAAASLSSTGEA